MHQPPLLLKHAAPPPKPRHTHPRVASQREVRETLLAPLDGELHGDERSTFINICEAFFARVEPADKGGDSADKEGDSDSSSDTELFAVPFDFPSTKVRIAPPSRRRRATDLSRAREPEPVGPIQSQARDPELSTSKLMHS